MSYIDKYIEWLKKADDDTLKELKAIEGNEKEIEDRFYKPLDFGTAGLRGIMGAGTNRMNKYIICQATQALAQIVKEKGMQDKGAVIAYDCRIRSDEFAGYCASVLAANGIKVYIWDSLRPTPELSYAIRKLKAITGINVTASHNPKIYNGYKVYWSEGSQILDDIAGPISDRISRIDPFKDVLFMDFKEGVRKGMINILGEVMDEAFMKEVLDLSLTDDIDKSLKIVYTPLNGTGLIPITKILKRRGFTDVTVVKEQEMPDGTFPTTPYPNPENIKVFDIPKRYAMQADADIVIATDPDADRIAIMAKNDKGRYVPFTGNQTGALLADFMLSRRKEKGLDTDRDAVIQTIVSGSLVPKIAEYYGCTVFETLTGFKYICDYANIWEKTKEYNYVFGYEESIGYCLETFTRDKDGVSAAMMICEMAAYYKKRNLTLWQVLEMLYARMGYLSEKQISVEYPGIEGELIKQTVMTRWRKDPLVDINGFRSIKTKDYIGGLDGLPPQNALKYLFEDGTWYAIRPSGTEPKLKVYINTMCKTRKKAEKLLKEFTDALNDYLKVCAK